VQELRVMIFATIDEWKGRGMASSRTVTEGDETYDETLKRFSGIPADLVELVVAESKDRAIQEGRRTKSGIKRGKIYGEILTGYMDAVDAGTVIPTILSKAKPDKVVSVSIWIRPEIAERFTDFVQQLPNGNKSEVLSAALRWHFQKQR
jgi:hypothetical protein